MFMSSELSTSPILTSALDAFAPSLTPLLIAMCECSSIIPAVKCFPFASIVFAKAPLGTSIFSAMRTIFPSKTYTSYSFKLTSA